MSNEKILKDYERVDDEISVPFNEVSEYSEGFLEAYWKSPNWMMRWGIIVISISVVIVLILGFVIKYPDRINSKVLITTQNPIEEIVSKTTGRISIFTTADGQNVKENQVLAVIENSARYNDILRLKALVDSTSKSNSTSTFYFPIEHCVGLSFGDIGPAYADFEKNYLKYALNKTLPFYKNELEFNTKIVGELMSRLNIMTHQKNLELAELALKKTDFARQETLFKHGVIAEQEFEQKKIAIINAERNYEITNVTLSQLKENIYQAEHTLNNISLNKQKDDLELLKSVLSSFSELKKEISQWTLKYVIKSSIAGKVSLQKYWAMGQGVKEGEVIASILPDDLSKLLGKMTIKAFNSGKIKAGQKVIIMLDNYPFQEFGTVYGKIKSISVNTDDNGEYHLEVELPRGIRTSFNKQIAFKQQLRGSAFIVTDDLRLIERFFYSLRGIFGNVDS